MQLPELHMLVKLQHLSMRDCHAPFIMPLNISGLARMPDSIVTVDLSHCGHVIMSGPILSLALKPNLRRVMWRHCQPIVGNLGDDIARCVKQTLATMPMSAVWPVACKQLVAGWVGPLVERQEQRAARSNLLAWID